jgi:uncharacterized OsmC-like protein
MRPDPTTIRGLKVSVEATMAATDIAAAMQRVESVLKRRPAAGIHDDAPATACWQTGMRIVASHANGTQMATDMPTELGGSGDQVTPGWLFRAGLASCCATRIAMGAAAAGIELTRLEVSASSRSDTRGLFGLADVSGEPVGAGPRDVQLVVRISALGVSAQRLRTLVEDCNRCSPVSAALRDAVPLALQIEVDTA